MTYTVTQEDRKAAAGLIGSVGLSYSADMLRAGKSDHHDYVQAFARHRIETLERAADVAEHHSKDKPMTHEQIAKGLIPMERERLTGWQGPAGAAYNAISDGLQERGLLNQDWSLSAKGIAVRAILEKQDD